MNRLKERIDAELHDLTFSPDTEAIARRFTSHRRKSHSAILGALVILFAATAAVILMNSPAATGTADTAASPASEHIFFLTASAAEVSATPDEPHKSIAFSPRTCKISVNYFGGESGMEHKSFSIDSSAAIIAHGVDIRYLIYHSDHSTFRSPALNQEVNNIKVSFDPDRPEDSALIWLIPSDTFDQWCEDMNTIDGPVDFSLLPRDRVTVTAVFADGTEREQTLNLWFNDSGYLVMQCEDGTIYFDYDDSTAHNPLHYDAHLIDPENISRATVTLYEPSKEDIEVANIPGLVSELWAMELYEPAVQPLMDENSPLIRIGMADGTEHTVRVTLTYIEIDGKVCRADHAGADHLLSFCYGLREKNEAGVVVYGEYDQ